jgi:hypothetical protein
MSPDPVTKSVFEEFQKRLDERHTYLSSEISDMKQTLSLVIAKMDKTLDQQRKFLMKIAMAALGSGAGAGFLSSMM